MPIHTTLRSRTWRGALACTVLVAAFGASSEAEEGASSFELVRDRIILPVWINETGPFAFLLDTGTGNTIIHAGTADSLALKRDPVGQLEANDAEGTMVAVEKAHVDSLRWAGADFPAPPLLAMDLSGFRAQLGVEIGGMMGLGGVVLTGREMTLDFNTREISLRDKENFLLASEAGTVPIRFSPDGMPLVAVIVEKATRPGDPDQAIQFMAGIDTTCVSTIAIPADKAEKMGLLTQDTPQLIVECAPGRNGKGPSQTQVRLKAVAIGQSRVEDALCTVGGTTSNMPVIGVGFLKHFRPIINFEKGWLRLDPRSGVPAQDGPIEGYGLIPAGLDRGYWRAHVAQGSPAALAGALPGDRILEVNGASMKNAAFGMISQLLCAPAGAPAEVSVVRDTSELKFRLVSKKLL